MTKKCINIFLLAFFTTACAAAIPVDGNQAVEAQINTVAPKIEVSISEQIVEVDSTVQESEASIDEQIVEVDSTVQESEASIDEQIAEVDSTVQELDVSADGQIAEISEADIPVITDSLLNVPEFHNVALFGVRQKKILTSAPIKDIDIELPSFSIASALFNIDEGIYYDDNIKSVFEEFDIPVTDTPRVQYYLRYFTGSGKESMQQWINRSNRYMHIVRDIFEREGIPLDLAVLSFTESGFNPTAYSRAGAVGMWQFMPATGKLYGLVINQWVDERRDFEKSTIAAAKHLSDLYRMFEDWYLALAAYNAGSGRIRSATKKHRSNDFFTIASTRTLKLETRDYVPKYLAHLLVYKNLFEYGFTPPQELPLLFDTVVLKRQVNTVVVAKAIGSSLEEMKILNPELRTPMTPPVNAYSLRVPLGKGVALETFLKDPKSEPTRYTLYNGKSGESLAVIAKKHNTTIQNIQKVNHYNYGKLYASRTLFIPKNNVKIDELDDLFAKEIATNAPKYYTVRKGDNMTVISKKLKIPLFALIKLNPKVNPRKIYPGQVLIVSNS
jgi:membrane-bound lytic murein transglycosylase D